MLVIAGVHGDEYEGIAAIPQLFAATEPQHLRGSLLLMPVCNLPAYEAAQRSSPVDGLNLARVFPGEAKGTITRQIAFWITEKLLRHADFLIDLHTGGIAYELPTLIGYIHDEGELGQASLAAATAFGAPVMWGHPMPMPAGRSISAATELGVPSLYTEAPRRQWHRCRCGGLFSRGRAQCDDSLGYASWRLESAALDPSFGRRWQSGYGHQRALRRTFYA